MDFESGKKYTLITKHRDRTLLYEGLKDNMHSFIWLDHKKKVKFMMKQDHPTFILKETSSLSYWYRIKRQFRYLKLFSKKVLKISEK